MMPKKNRTALIVVLAITLALLLGLLQWGSSAPLRGTSLYAPIYQPMTMTHGAAVSGLPSRTSLKELRDRRMQRAQRRTKRTGWSLFEYLSTLLANLLANLLARLPQL